VPRNADSNVTIPVRLTQAQRKVVAEIAPEFAARLRLDGRCQRTIAFTRQELKVIQKHAAAGVQQASTGMKRNSLQHVADLIAQALEHAQGILSIPASERVYQFKITLKESRPPIWRRIQVMSAFRKCLPLLRLNWLEEMPPPLLLVLLLLQACSGRKMDAKGHQWRNDADALRQSLPFIGAVVKCAWITGVDQDRSHGLPGPSSRYLRGYAVLSTASFEELQRKYTWKESNVDTNSLQVPMEDDRLAGDALESTSLTRELPTLSVYHQGRIYLVPQSNVVYFDLIRD
jgi:hypothetical protein